MFPFWYRKSTKSPAAGRTSDILPLSSEPNADVPPPISRSQLRQNSTQQDTPPPHAVPEYVVAAVPTPHDAAIAEVHAKLLQVEQLSQIGRSRTSIDDPLSDASNTSRPTAEPLFDPATGVQRGFFEPVSTSGDSDQPPEEAWTHLARIKELQSEIAMMHMHMEGIGDASSLSDVEVDVDIDVDTVQTQEEEEAAKRAKEFEKLPGRFKGRSDKIDAMMTKLDALSQAVNAFHALQPPPLNFESPATSRENTSNAPPPPNDTAVPTTARTKTNTPAAAVLGKKIGLDQNQVVEMLHDSPVSAHAGPFPLGGASK